MRRRAVRLRVGGDVVEVVDAVQLLLDDLHDRVLQRLRGGAGIAHVDADRGRRDRGILAHRQREDREAARDHDDDRDHPREDRTVDEEASTTCGWVSSRPSARGDVGSRRACAEFLGRRHGLHRDAGLDLLQAVDDHAVAGRRGRP